VEALGKLGAQVIRKPSLSAQELPDNLEGVEVLIVRSTKVTASAIEAASALSLIVRAGAGVNTIDLEAASSRGIFVANCPEKNCDAVAELTIGLLIATDRGIAGATRDLREGRWEKSKYGNAQGLKGRFLGIIGLGSIGKAVAERAHGMKMNVLGYSRSFTKDLAKQYGITYCSNLNEVAQNADAITVHLAASPETIHFIGSDFFAAMKKGAILVNTSRGEVVDTSALKKAIKEKGIRVGLDVFENERAGWDRVVVAYAQESVARKVRKEIRQNLDEAVLEGHVDFIPVRHLTE